MRGGAAGFCAGGRRSGGCGPNGWVGFVRSFAGRCLLREGVPSLLKTNILLGWKSGLSEQRGYWRLERLFLGWLEWLLTDGVGFADYPVFVLGVGVR